MQEKFREVEVDVKFMYTNFGQCMGFSGFGDIATFLCYLQKRPNFPF